MTQGLQISMLLSTDTSLKSDSAKADGGSDGDGAVFGSMFGELVQPAKNDPADAKLRQLPAAVGPLSGISQALQSAGMAASSEEATSADSTEDTLLAASLLEQLALKDKSRSAKAASEQAAASSDNKEAGQDIAQLARANATAAQQAASDEMPVEAHTADNNAEADSAAGQTDNAASATKQTITDAKNVAVADTETTEQKPASRYDNAQIARGSKMTVDSAVSADKAIPVPPEDGDISAVGVNAENAEDLALLNQAAVKTETKLAAVKSPETGSGKVKASADETLAANSAKLSAEDTPALASAGALNVQAPNEAQTASDTEQKTSNANAAEKLLKSDSDKADSKSAAKQGAEQSGQQQQRQTHGHQGGIDQSGRSFACGITTPPRGRKRGEPRLCRHAADPQKHLSHAIFNYC